MYMADDSLAFLSIKAQGELLSSRKVSPVELTQLYLDRISRLNGQLNSYNTVCGEMALAAAHTAEREIHSGRNKGPMHGIPVAVKDQMNIVGVPNTGGSRYFRDFVAEADATVIANLKQNGAILLGTLSSSEFSMGGTTEHLFGTPKNPWDLERTPGGSSSGAGSSVAAGLCSGAVGEDTGGSIRGPASMCGIAGLKPTWSRISRHGVYSLCWAMDCAGPMARSAEDCAIMLRSLAGYDPHDPTSSREPVPDYTSRLTSNLNGVRVGIVEEMVDDGFDADTRKAVDGAVSVVAELGASVSRVSIPLIKTALGVHTAVVDAEAASYHRGRLLKRYDDYDYNTRLRILVGTLLPSGMHTLATRARAAIGAQVLQVLTTYDVLVGATSMAGAAKLTTGTGVTSKEDALTKLYGRAGTTAFNMSGSPAISVPCGFNAEGMPLGFHIAGRLFDEATVLRVAHAYQKATDWHTRRPPVS
jgi:aspartyl-tRNA(Asn)/glutamyl-tRNA(Gln) amidotransferase subunit A